MEAWSTMNTEIVKLEFRRFNASVGSAVRSRVAVAWATGATTVVLDFTGVANIDSLGVSVLVSEHRRRPPETRIVLCGLNDYVREVLEITQLVRLFDVYATSDAIISAPAS
jgi:anti-anti-sigma factor